jgi:hypothetical protein
VVTGDDVIVGAVVTDGVDSSTHGAGGFACVAHAGGRMGAHGCGIDGCGIDGCGIDGCGIDGCGIDGCGIEGQGLVTGDGFMVVVATMADSWGEQGRGTSQPERACGTPDAANDGSNAAATATASTAPEKRILRSMTPIPSLGTSGCPYPAYGTASWDQYRGRIARIKRAGRPRSPG